MEKLRLSKEDIKKELKGIKNTEALSRFSRKYLGKKGILKKFLRSIKDLPQEKRAKTGREVNELKYFLEKQIELRKKKIENVNINTSNKEKIDITVPGKKIKVGHLHPLTQIKRQIEGIFTTMGFSVVEGLEIETEWYNFDAVNMPKDHPSRDMQDTFWLKRKKKEGEKFLMRTQTTAVQVRYMEKNTPPFRIIVPGKVYRYEATDASHEVHFHQCEGLLVDREVSIANLKAVLEMFLERFFGKGLEFRWRPSYFPYVEPGLEIDIRCSLCKGKGCSACGGTGWVEVLGAGMIHPSVFRAAGYVSNEWKGFAFGVGIERLAMIRYRIGDIRLFYSGDLRFLDQF